MSEKPLESITILVASSSAEERENLRTLVTRADSTGTLWEKSTVSLAETAAQAREQLAAGGVDLCLLGTALGEDEQDALIRTDSRRLAAKPTLMIPVLERGDQKTLMRFIQAGARGILLSPVLPDAFVEVLRNAVGVRPAARPASAKDEASLPWVLEHVAERLTELAERVREEEGATPVRANAKLIKEALLGVIGTSSAEQEQSLMRLAELLAREGQA